MAVARAIDPSERLVECEERQVSVLWPTPISKRVDELARLLDREGDGPHRKDVLGALVLNAPTGKADLSSILSTYQSAQAKDAAGGGLSAERILSTRRDQRGRRKRSGRSKRRAKKR